ncbi:MAG: hypothetical protein QF699_05075 [Candidatus Poseidoniaceae archaeon]|nr:hypothetical protein [Candidatus Poseidoniaceae archaeon]
MEEIPNDSIFCPECGARQEVSRAGSFANTGAVGLGGQEVAGGRNFGVVSGEAIRQQRDAGQGQVGGLPPEVLQQIAMGVQQQQNIPQGQFPPQQGMPPHQMGQFPPQGLPPQQGMPPNQMGQFPPQQGMPPNQGGQIPQANQQPTNVVGGAHSDLPQSLRGPSLSSGAVPQKNPANVTGFNPGGTMVANNPSASPTDAMVNRLAEAERAMKDERRSQWLNMNQTPAGNVLASLGAELPSHLRGGDTNVAKEIMAGALGQPSANAPDEALLRRMCEVAVRRVARKRGVAVETPQAKTEGEELKINVTYVDDGRVLDTPDDLKQAFEHAIQTEMALKGFDLIPVLTIFRSKDGEVENLDQEKEDDDEEMFACEICDGLVKESDSECPHCGAIFEDEEEEEVQTSPQRSGPPGPGRSGGPPKKSGGPPGPSRSGGPPKKSGGPPKRSGGPPGPSKSGGPPKKSGGPPKKSGGPPGPSKSGGPPKKSGGPPGPSKSGGPPKKSGGPPKKSGGPPGPSKSGGPPKKSGGPPKKSGGPPKRSGPPKGGPGGGPPGPKRGPR